jgi:hypothetical protein
LTKPTKSRKWSPEVENTTQKRGSTPLLLSYRLDGAGTPKIMSIQDSNEDQFGIIRQAGTGAPNFDMDTEAIIARLQQWQTLCKFKITAAGHDTVNIKFDTLPADMGAFAEDVYDFCPDLVDQGTGCVREMVEEMDEVPPNMLKLIEGIDFEDENYGIEILKREIEQRKELQLWWD